MLTCVLLELRVGGVHHHPSFVTTAIHSHYSHSQREGGGSTTSAPAADNQTGGWVHHPSPPPLGGWGMWPLPWNFMAVLMSCYAWAGGVGHVTVTMELHGCVDVLLRLGWGGWGGACYRYHGTSWLCWCLARLGLGGVGVGHVTVTMELHGCVDVLLRLGLGGGTCYRYHGTSQAEPVSQRTGKAFWRCEQVSEDK